MIQEAIHQVIIARRRIKPPSSLHPSSLGLCERRAILEATELPTNPIDPRLLRVFSAGEIFEAWVSEALQEAGIAVASQVPVRKGAFSGRIDAILAVNHSFHILEIKTVHSRAFWHGRKDGQMPYEHHIHQVWAYQTMLQEWDGQKLSYPILCYISKDDLAIREFQICLSDRTLVVRNEQGVPIKQMIANTEDLMLRLERFLESGELPPPPFSSPREHPFLCQRRGRITCPFYSKCW